MYVSDKTVAVLFLPTAFLLEQAVFEMEHFLALQMGLQPRQRLLLTKRLPTWCSRPHGFVAGRRQGAALCWEVCLDYVGKHSVHEHPWQFCWLLGSRSA